MANVVNETFRKAAEAMGMTYEESLKNIRELIDIELHEHEQGHVHGHGLDHDHQHDHSGESMAYHQHPISTNEGFYQIYQRAGVLGLAIGFILGAAVSKLVAALVTDVANPLLGIFLGKAAGLKEDKS